MLFGAGMACAMGAPIGAGVPLGDAVADPAVGIRCMGAGE